MTATLREATVLDQECVQLTPLSVVFAKQYFNNPLLRLNLNVFNA